MEADKAEHAPRRPLAGRRRCVESGCRHRPKSCVSWSQLEVFLAMAEDALRAKSIANELLQHEAELARQEQQTRAEEYHDLQVVKAEIAMLDDTEILNQELQRMSVERAGYRETISRLERENGFLLEERDLLCQQLASEARTITPAPRQAASSYYTPTAAPSSTPSTTSATRDHHADPEYMSSAWSGARGGEPLTPSTPPYRKRSRPSAGLSDSSSQPPDRPPETRRAGLLAELRERYSQPLSNGYPGLTLNAHAPAGHDSEMSTPPLFGRRVADETVQATDNGAKKESASQQKDAISQAAPYTPFHTPAASSTACQTPEQWRGSSCTAKAHEHGSEGEVGPWRSNPVSSSTGTTPFQTPAFVSTASQTSIDHRSFLAGMEFALQRQGQLQEEGAVTPASASRTLSSLSAADVPFLHPESRKDSPRSQPEADLELADLTAACCSISER